MTLAPSTEAVLAAHKRAEETRRAIEQATRSKRRDSHYRHTDGEPRPVSYPSRRIGDPASPEEIAKG